MMRPLFILVMFVATSGRMIPPSPYLLSRYDMVNDLYGGLIDKKTRKHLLWAEAREAVKRLRVHIKAECLIDPAWLPMHFQAGKDSATGSFL